MEKRRINVTRSSLPPIEEYFSEIQPLWETACLTNMGTLYQKFEKEAADYLQVPNISLFTNGHLALEIALQALDLTGEVITTPFTFVSTSHAIARNRLQPVFCDIKADDYTLDPAKIEALITAKTSAIIPVHVYGHVCDFTAIDKIAQKYHLKVIYDAAHAFGVQVNGAGIGNLGDISMFSFHATKVFHTIEGGALTYADENLTGKLNRLKNFGLESPESVKEIGLNAKMNEFQAAMGICNLRHIDAQIDCRKKIAERYYENLRENEGLKMSLAKANIKANYAYFPLLVDEKKFPKNRDKIIAVLQKENIFSRRYFYPLVNRLGCYQDLPQKGETPVADYVAERILTLPLYAELALEDVDRICGIILGV